VRAEGIKVFVSLEHGCGYYGDRVARNLILDPLAEPQIGIYGHAIQRGFRRAGPHIYRPYCSNCQACVASRIDLGAFKHSRKHRRCLKANADLTLRVMPACYTDEYFGLYQRYLQRRHSGKGMDDGDEQDFANFLYAHWSKTQFLEFRLAGQLVAVAVTDPLPGALSAVYTFYDPDLAKRSLGSFAILSQIQMARSLGCAHLYLGYWIEGHPKMHYKREYSGTEIFQNGIWQPLE
jgi:leucyl-tRNA---protein transferase